MLVTNVLLIIKRVFVVSTISLLLTIPLIAIAQVPLSQNSLQLQQLITKSEQQIKALKEILKQNKNDAETLEKTQKILNKLTNGIDQSIKEYQGTKAYEKAILELQAKDDYKSTYSDTEKVRQNTSSETTSTENNFADENLQKIKIFQKQSVQANQYDLEQQDKLQHALQKAGPGFIPKIQAQTQLGNWQTNTRVSAQFTELLAAMNAMREEVRAMRLKDEKKGNALDMLIRGSEIQNQKLRKKR